MQLINIEYLYLQAIFCQYILINLILSLGVLDMEYQLTEQPKYGDWKIRVDAFVSYSNLLNQTYTSLIPDYLMGLKEYLLL